MFVIGSQIYTYYKSRNGAEATIEDALDGNSGILFCPSGSCCVNRIYKVVAYSGKPFDHYGETVGVKRRFEKCDERTRQKIAIFLDLLLAVAAIVLHYKATQLKIPYTVAVILATYGGFAMTGVIFSLGAFALKDVVPLCIANQAEGRKAFCCGIDCTPPAPQQP